MAKPSASEQHGPLPDLRPSNHALSGEFAYGLHRGVDRSSKHRHEQTTVKPGTETFMITSGSDQDALLFGVASTTVTVTS